MKTHPALKCDYKALHQRERPPVLIFGHHRGIGPQAFSAEAGTATSTRDELGQLPEWKLDDLYPGMESREFKADLERAQADCKTFAAEYRGKIASLAADAGAASAVFAAIERFEKLDDLLGRLISYAGLI